MLVGLSGPLGAGKSMAARILATELRAEVVPFAAPLKRMVLALGVDERHVFGTQAEKEQPLDVFGGKSARFAMQTLGTEWGREFFGADFWCRAWLAALPAGRNVIADDARFVPEADTILSRGGCVIRIVRDLADENKAAQHASEDFTKVPFSFRVVNDKCPTILKERLLSGLNAWQGCRAEATRARAVEARF